MASSLFGNKRVPAEQPTTGSVLPSSALPASSFYEANYGDWFPDSSEIEMMGCSMFIPSLPPMASVSGTADSGLPPLPATLELEAPLPLAYASDFGNPGSAFMDYSHEFTNVPTHNGWLDTTCNAMSTPHVQPMVSISGPADFEFPALPSAVQTSMLPAHASHLENQAMAFGDYSSADQEPPSVADPVIDEFMEFPEDFFTEEGWIDVDETQPEAVQTPGEGGVILPSSSTISTISSLQTTYTRKTRMCWTANLQRKFVEAIDKLGGIDRATPKKILNLMEVEGLTIAHVKSHLQKYRITMKGQQPTNTPDDPVTVQSYHGSGSVDLQAEYDLGGISLADLDQPMSDDPNAV